MGYLEKEFDFCNRCANDIKIALLKIINAQKGE